jgi:8-oxo-dGTP pyrophosphatase MutT (NUDIX family)
VSNLSEAVRAALASHRPRVIGERDPSIVRVDTAVLVPLELGAEPRVIMTVRASSLRHHAGEVCFPGGKPHPDDSDLIATALREAEEEIGLLPSEVEIAGALSPMPTATSHFRLHPFVGLIAEGRAAPRLSEEVGRVLELPFRALVDGTYAHRAIRVDWGGQMLLSPFFILDDNTRLYGASAHILLELLHTVGPALGYVLPEAELVTDSPW